MSFAFKRRVGAKNLNLGPRMSVKNWNTEKKNRGRNWEELKNIYPCRTTDSVTYQTGLLVIFLLGLEI